MAPPSTLQLPAPDEIEVSVFGPGRGEGIAVHLGNSTWITIDSCVNQRTASNVLIDYFSQIGVDPAESVELVVATHAHDDHTAGLGALFESARNAWFVPSGANASSQFFASVVADEEFEKQLNQSVRREFRAVLGEIRRRRKPAVRIAHEQRVLLRLPATGNVPAVTVTALSPSDTAILRANTRIAEGSAQAGQRKKLAGGDPNEHSVALWIEIGAIAVLLGADLIIGPDACGWKHVDETHHPTLTATLFKIPHHGSSNAHYSPTWARLVSDDALAVLTPYRMGDKSIPQSTDLERINSLAARTYVTANPVAPTPSRELKRSRAILGNVARNIREVDGVPGQVRARRRISSAEWRVDTFAPAYEYV